jgi:hypothetical protein
MSVLAEDTRAIAPVSPELVLVSSPEVARLARSLLATRPPAPAPVTRDVRPRHVELAVVWLICIAMTLGPLLFLLIARP